MKQLVKQKADSVPAKAESTAETRASRQRPRHRILFTLMVILIVAGLAPVATVAWKVIDTSREELKTATQEYQLLLAESVANDLDYQVSGMSDQMLSVAQTLGAGMRRRGDIRQEEVQEILAGVSDRRILHLRYSYFRANNYLNVETGELPAELEPNMQAGLQQISAMRVAADGAPDIAHVSSPVVLQGSPPRTVAVISAPVSSGGRFRGVLSAVYDFQSIWSSIASRNNSGHNIFACDGTGKLFASTDPVRFRPGYFYESPIVERFVGHEGRMRETMPFELTSSAGETHEFLGSFETTRLNWGVFVLAKTDDVYLPVEGLIRSTLTWAGGALFLAIIAAFFFARTLTQPIRRLVAATRAFAIGDFSPRVEIHTQNELAELGETFNQMAAQIEDHILKLQDAAHENNELFLGTIRALAQAIDAKDPYTRGHSLRVNRYSVIIARHMGLPDEEVKDIYVASLLHDVGKIGIDDAVLKKPGRLTDAEFEIIKKHPVLGAEIMAPMRKMQRIIPGLRWHHERWAGGGYPDGLVADQIPLMARIIAVADTFDAMTTHRPYQTAMTFSEALDRINTVLKGNNLDPMVVDAFNMACELGRIRPRAELENTAEINVEAIRA